MRSCLLLKCEFLNLLTTLLTRKHMHAGASSRLAFPAIVAMLLLHRCISTSGTSRVTDGQTGGEMLVRQPGGRTVGTADRLAVGVSLLTRPDSFHAGSCDSEREDRVTFRPFAVPFEGTARFACVCFFNPCCVSLPGLLGALPRRVRPVTYSDSEKQTS